MTTGRRCHAAPLSGGRPTLPERRDLKVAHCDDVACTTASRHTIDSAGDVGWYTSVAIGAEGLGLIIYRDLTNGDLKVAHCGVVVC